MPIVFFMSSKSSKKELKKVLFDILSIDSSKNEKELIGYLRKYCQSNGFDTLLHKGNLIVLLNNDSDKVLHFNAHTDTVKTNPKTWETNPWKPVEKEGKIYGLGASDNKASVVALLGTIEELVDTNIDCDFYFAFPRKEETSGAGSKSFMDFYVKQELPKRYAVSGCVVLEPTDLKKIEYGNRGNLFVKFETKGKSCHASRPHEGENAFLKMVDVVGRLKAFEQHIKKYNDNDLGRPTIAIGTKVKGGLSINKVPDYCKLTCDVRTVPGFHERAIELMKEYTGDLAKVSFAEKPALYSLTPKDSFLVKLVQEVTHAELGISKSSNDACFYTERGIPAVVFGPGTMAIMHCNNEYVIWKNVPKSVSAYVKIAKKFSQLKEGVL